MGFWSKFGKILKTAAPIAAMAIPGVGPLAAAAIAGGGSALGNKMAGGSWKGSLINGLINGGAAGLMPGAGAAGGAAKQGIGGTLRRVGGSLLTNMLNPDTLTDISRGVGAIGKTQAHNRGVELDAMMAADEMRMAQDRDRRADESHIMKNTRANNYIMSGGMKKTPRMSALGTAIPSFSSPAPITEGEKAAATTLNQQLMARLMAPPKLRDYDSKMKPGMVENIANWGSPIAGIFAGIQRRRLAPQLGQPTETEIPTLELPDSIFTPGGQAPPTLREPDSIFSGNASASPTFRPRQNIFNIDPQ